MGKSIIALTILLTFIFNINYCQDYNSEIKKIFSFPVKSMFQYRTTVSHESPYQDIIIEKYIIDDKWWNGSTLYYTRKGFYESSVYSILQDNYYDSSIRIINDTIIIMDTIGHYLNAFDSQLVHIDSNNDYYSYVKIDDSGKSIGGLNNLYEYNVNDSLILLDSEGNFGYNFTQVFKYGIGMYLKSYGNMMNSTTTKLDGYVINGDTTGTIND